MKPKKKAATQQPKHAANPKVKADCKESLELVSFLVWQDNIKMIKDNKKIRNRKLLLTKKSD